MKKLALLVMVAVMAAAPMVTEAEAKDAGAAVVLSGMMPGTGEWYNSGWQGQFPFVECIAGYICPCVTFSSIFDAAAGKTEPEEMRLDFWTAPR